MAGGGSPATLILAHKGEEGRCTYLLINFGRPRVDVKRIVLDY